MIMQEINTAVNNLTSQGNGTLLWICMIILASKFAFSHGVHIDLNAQLTTGERQADLLEFLEQGGVNETFATYEAEQFNVISYESPITDYLDSISGNMDKACALIPLWNKMCAEEPTTCQLTSIAIETLENAISTLTHTIFSLNGVCELPDLPSSKEVISRYHNNQPWSTGDGVSERHKFLEEMMQGYHSFVMRHKRFIISGPIFVATANGLLSSAGAITASYAVPHSESAQVSEEQNFLRKVASENAITNNIINNNVSVKLYKAINGIHYIHTLSTKTANLFHNAQHLENRKN